MRHIIIRTIMALVWIAAAIVSLTKGNTQSFILGLIMGIAFGGSALMMIKKNKKATK